MGVKTRHQHHRPPTLTESLLIAEVFDGQLAVENMQIVHGYWIKPLFPLPMIPMAPNGCIYFHPIDRNYRHDFCEPHASTEQNARLLHLFVHEMTHVWQHQRGCHVVWCGLVLHIWFQPLAKLCKLLSHHAFFKNLLVRHNIYRYQAGEQAVALNIEQQAEVFADWFLLKHFPQSLLARQRQACSSASLADVSRLRGELLAYHHS
ncbi:MAG: hypothetical protein HOP04_11250 [Methylophilaceae bacterium]|nr:hypothetical protein [Methylophilaceae bacterium]